MSAYDDILTARDELVARGWHKGDLEGPNGEVCLMGALNLACFGKVKPSFEELNPAIAGIADSGARRRERAHAALMRRMPEARELAEFNDANDVLLSDVFNLIDETLADLS